MGLLSLSNIAIYMKKAEFFGFLKSIENDFKGEIASKIQFGPTYCIQTGVCNQIINEKMNKKSWAPG